MGVCLVIGASLLMVERLITYGSLMTGAIISKSLLISENVTLDVCLIVCESLMMGICLVIGASLIMVESLTTDESLMMGEEFNNG